MRKTRQRSTASRTDLLDRAIFSDIPAYAALNVTSHMASLSSANHSLQTSYNNKKENKPQDSLIPLDILVPIGVFMVAPGLRPSTKFFKSVDAYVNESSAC